MIESLFSRNGVVAYIGSTFPQIKTVNSGKIQTAAATEINDYLLIGHITIKLLKTSEKKNIMKAFKFKKTKK